MIPVADPTVATVLSLLLQVPPGAASVNVMVAPAHTVVVAAVMLPAVVDGLTVTVVVTVVVQPKAFVAL